MRLYQVDLALEQPTSHCCEALPAARTPLVLQGEHRSSDKSLQRASARLLAALTHGESAEQRLAMPLLVLLAQQRKLIVLQSQVGCLAGVCVGVLEGSRCLWQSHALQARC